MGQRYGGGAHHTAARQPTGQGCGGRLSEQNFSQFGGDGGAVKSGNTPLLISLVLCAVAALCLLVVAGFRSAVCDPSNCAANEKLTQLQSELAGMSAAHQELQREHERLKDVLAKIAVQELRGQPEKVKKLEAEAITHAEQKSFIATQNNELRKAVPAQELARQQHGTDGFVVVSLGMGVGCVFAIFGSMTIWLIKHPVPQTVFYPTKA